jgi:hypothetical protein
MRVITTRGRLPSFCSTRKGPISRPTPTRVGREGGRGRREGGGEKERKARHGLHALPF